MTDGKIIVDIENPLDVSRNLDIILTNLDDLCANAIENNGIKFISQEYSGMEYGRYQEGSFVEHPINLHKNMPSYSELAYFLSAVKDNNNTNKVLAFVRRIMEKNQQQKVWLDEEMPMGLNASFALAYNDKNHISEFIDFLRTCDMNHEVYQHILIELLENKWGICNQVLKLLATRTNSISGQWGVESHEPLSLSSEQKKYYFKVLLEDVLFSKTVFPNLLVGACGTLGISINENKFNALFVNHGAFSSPIFKISDINNIAQTL